MNLGCNVLYKLSKEWSSFCHPNSENIICRPVKYMCEILNGEVKNKIKINQKIYFNILFNEFLTACPSFFEQSNF